VPAQGAQRVDITRELADIEDEDKRLDALVPIGAGVQ